MKIPIAHDFICPWCWIGLFQAKKLREEFGVDFDWLGYELFPDELEWGSYSPPVVDSNRPKIPSRLELAYAAQGMERRSPSFLMLAPITFSDSPPA